MRISDWSSDVCSSDLDDAGGLAVVADPLADRAQVAPVAADAAAARGQPDVLVPQPDDAVQAVAGLVEEAGDRPAARGAAVGEHRRRRHEPRPRDVVVEALGAWKSGVEGKRGTVSVDTGGRRIIKKKKNTKRN